MMEKEVFKMAQEYFKEHLPDYQLLEVRPASSHPDDYYMWLVSGYHPKTDTYAFWSSFNTTIEGGSLNHGHYGLKKSTVEKMFEDFYHDHTKESIND